MNPNEKTKGIWNPVWPQRREAMRRLSLIAIILLPLWWTVFALLVGDWRLNLTGGPGEPVRHLVEGIAILLATLAVIFLASLLPVFHWIFNRRNARRFFLAGVWIVTLAVLFYAEEDWRGTRAWKKYRERLEARGVQLDLATFTPKQIPDEQNFAATPFVQKWFTDRTNAHQWTDDAYYRTASWVADVTTDKSKRHFLDLVAWKMAFDAVNSGQTNLNQEFKSNKFDLRSRAEAAPTVLEMLKADEIFFAELRAASQRPYSRYPVFYDMENPWGILLPHLTNIKRVCELLRLKACAELAAGRSDAALEDVKFIFFMADSVKNEPFLISHLVRLACVHLATQPVWEGLAEHRWSDAQLQELQVCFQQFDFIADMKRSLDGERAAGAMTADIVRKKGLGMLIELIGPGSPSSLDKKFANWCGGLIPHGWYYQEQLSYCRLFEVQNNGTFDAAKKRVSPSQIEINNYELDREFSGGRLGRFLGAIVHHHVIAGMLLPALGRIQLKAAKAQVTTDQAVIACALERYRIANGNFPETLDALTPKFISILSTDPLTGEPYKYRRIDKENFILYSIGWNERNNGGGDVLSKVLSSQREGDWVWKN